MGSQPLIKPPALGPGDCLGILAPGSGIQAEKLWAGVRELESMGFRTRFRDDIHSNERYLAGGVERRIAEFREMLQDDGVQGMICARGGFGSGHLLGALEPEELRDHAKVFCGASDITMLLAAFDRAGVVAFHSPMVATAMPMGPAGYDRDLMMRMLVDGEAVTFDTSGCEVIRRGRAEGRLIGGCLSVVVSTLGTPSAIDTRDSILVLEDIDEKPYRIDRMLTQLRQAGKLDGVRGFVFGEMVGCEQHPEQGYSIQSLIQSLVGDLGVPIMFGFPTGHSSKPNAIVPFGVQAEISCGSDPTFRLLEPAVRIA